MLKKEFKTMPLSALKPYGNNPRINDMAVADVKESMRQAGNIDPIEVDENMEILSGHTRYKALVEQGIAETDVLIVSGLTKAQKKKYRILANKAAERSLWDFNKLEVELDGLDFEGYDFGFDSLNTSSGDWFEREERDGASRQEGNEEYNEFLEKFESRKTTDDCYTPDPVYNAIADWVAKRYGLNRADFVRPFYPGGNYQEEKYKPSAVVVDNPPFSILAEIKRFYKEKGIRYFLFAPHLTLFSNDAEGVCFIPVGAVVTYENGAVVSTSFVTNLETEYLARNYPDLYAVIKTANDENLKETRKTMRKYVYPPYVITPSNFHQFAKHRIELNIRRGDAVRISALDSQRESGDAIFGGGLLISEREKAEREKAEREKAEREKAERWELSEREMAIIASLGKG